MGISIHLDFYWSREQTIKLKVGELYSRCIIVSSNTLNQRMKSICLKICFLVVVVAISDCNGQNEKIFGFLVSAEKCTKESDPKACVKRNLDGWCENRKENLIDGTRVASVCNCIEGNPSVEDVKDCIKEKIVDYCTNNAGDFKCEMFARCKDEGTTINDKKECAIAVCEEPGNANKFECLAISCRETYSLPPAKLECIKEACDEAIVDEDNLVCEKIKNCEEENEGAGRLGMLRIFRCLLKNVFDGLVFD